MPRMGRDTFVRVRLTGGAGSYILAPVLTTTQRDALTGAEGMIIFNSTTDQLEEYDGSTWQAVGQVIMTTHEAASAPHPNLITQGRVEVEPVAYSAIGQGSWALWIDASQFKAGGFRNVAGVEGDNLSYDIYLDKGTYTLRIVTFHSAAQGIMSVDIDEVEVASFDCYYATNQVNQIKSQTGIVIAAAGRKTLTIRSDTKNASASAYRVTLTAISLWRTA